MPPSPHRTHSAAIRAPAAVGASSTITVVTGYAPSTYFALYIALDRAAGKVVIVRSIATWILVVDRVLIRMLKRSCRIQVRGGFLQVCSTPTWRRVCRQRLFPPLSLMQGMHCDFSLPGLRYKSDIDLLDQSYPRLGTCCRGDGCRAGQRRGNDICYRSSLELVVALSAQAIDQGLERAHVPTSILLGSPSDGNKRSNLNWYRWASSRPSPQRTCSSWNSCA